MKIYSENSQRINKKILTKKLALVTQQVSDALGKHIKTISLKKKKKGNHTPYPNI